MIVQIVITVILASGVIPILSLRRKEVLREVSSILPHIDLGRSLITLLNGVGLLCTAFSLNVFGKTQPLIIALTLEVCGLLFALIALAVYPKSLKLASIIESEIEKLFAIFYKDPEKIDKKAIKHIRVALDEEIIPKVLEIITGSEKIYLYIFFLFYFYAYIFTLAGIVSLLIGVGTNIQF